MPSDDEDLEQMKSHIDSGNIRLYGHFGNLWQIFKKKTSIHPMNQQSHFQVVDEEK